MAKKVETLGAGEIVVTSVDKEGTGQGFDTTICHLISKNTSIPIVCHGGAASVECVQKVYHKTKCSGICVASVFHYGYINTISNETVQGRIKNKIC